MTRVKICGITRREDAMLAVELGAHALGFIFEPTSPRFLPEVPDWIDEIPPFVTRVAVFGIAPASFVERSFQAMQGVAESFGYVSEGTGGLGKEEWRRGGIKGAREDGFQRIAAVRVKPGEGVETFLNHLPDADALLLDAYAEGQFGGTGRQVDWDLAAEVVKQSPLPVILAGGLTPENVADAVRLVKPYAVDVASGVEATPGIKDAAKLRAFFRAVKSI